MDYKERVLEIAKDIDHMYDQRLTGKMLFVNAKLLKEFPEPAKDARELADCDDIQFAQLVGVVFGRSSPEGGYDPTAVRVAEMIVARHGPARLARAPSPSGELYDLIDQLCKLGNGNGDGNSDGNRIAQKARALLSSPSGAGEDK
jgi:hypothetical protein